MHQRVIIIFCYFFLLGINAHAEKTTIIADADEMMKNTPKKTLSLKGNVNVIFQQQHLLCDEAVVYEETNTIVAKGNVVLQSARTTLRGDKIEFNYDTNKGKIYKGVVTSGQVLIEAETIEKVGEDEYVADDAYYTACITCPPSWGFTSTNIKAEIGGYAYITRPWLHLLQFPVLPLPYLVVPLNSKRQTGFLVPRPFTSNDGGFSVEQPFFWAIDRSHDATFSFINYEKRGRQLATNYRYVISPTSSGEFNTAFLRDRTVEEDQYKNRWFVEYGHKYDLPEGYTQRTNLALASDRFYGLDFFYQFRHDGEPALDNSISLTKAFESGTLTVESSYYLSQIEEGRGFDDDQSLHRLPEINYNLVDQKISDDLNLFFNLDAQYLNIARSNGLAFEHTRAGTECTTFSIDEKNPGAQVLDDICYPTALSSGDFIYGAPADQVANSNQTYGDLIRTGQRFDIMPRIHAPFWVGNVLDVDPSFGVRYTQYSLGVESDESQGYDSFPNRFYGEFGLSTKSNVSKVFKWSEETKIKHSIIPQINLRYIPEIHQTNHNFFGTPDSLMYFREVEPLDDTDADWRNNGRGIQFDNNDRVIGKQIVTFGLINKIISRDTSSDKSYNSLASPYSRNFFFNVWQAYDINEARKGDEARPWQSINTLTAFNVGPITQSVSTTTFPYHARTQWRTNTRYKFLRNNYVGLGYSKQYRILLFPPVDEDKTKEFLNFSMGLSFPYVYFFGRIRYDLRAREGDLEEKFRSWSVATVITPPGSCWSINASLEKQANGPNIIPSINMEFKFGE